MPERAFPSFDVVILGAGVAGLTAAVFLAEAGLKPLVLEAAQTPGGRARSFVSAAFAEELDNGPHLLMGTYHHTLDLLDRLGSRSLLWEEDRVTFTFWSRDWGWHALACPDWPAPWHLLAGLKRFPGFSMQDWLAVMRLGLALSRLECAALEQQSVTQWLQKYRQTDLLFQRIWSPLCLATLNEPPASANAALFAAVLKRVFLSDRFAARPLLSTVPLSQLIAQPAQRFIHQAGGEVRCGCRVLGLEMANDTVQAIHTNRGVVYAPKATIIALPPVALARLLPTWARDRGVTVLQSSPIVSVHLSYSHPCQLPAALIGLPHESSQWIVDRGKIQNSAGHGGRFSAVLSAAYRERSWSSARLIASVHQDMVRLLPDLAAYQPTVARVIKEHRATFAAWPGSTLCRPKTQTPWKQVWLAGDWTHTGLPATLEGATQSGVAAARKTLDLWNSGG